MLEKYQFSSISTYNSSVTARSWKANTEKIGVCACSKEKKKHSFGKKKIWIYTIEKIPPPTHPLLCKRMNRFGY